MIWFWLGLVLMLSVPALAALWITFLYVAICARYLNFLARIFQEKPLFIIPRGLPVPEAEDVRLKTPDGLTLRGCYLPGAAPRRGVILFGLEFGSNRWSCVPYTDFLLEDGLDVFAVETRGQGDSDSLPGYEPLQWVTNYEVQDVRTALEYLKHRADADPRGVGFFGMSKGAGAALFVAAEDPYIRGCVTDGVFATYTTLVPYMRKWYGIYNTGTQLRGLFPSWFYGMIGLRGLRQISRERGCSFPHLEGVIKRLAPRPLLMIHGGADTYIKPDMARALFDRAGEPKEFWLVDGAKHNQALQVAGDEYRRRVLDFFRRCLAPQPAGGEPPDRGRDGPETRGPSGVETRPQSTLV